MSRIPLTFCVAICIVLSGCGAQEQTPTESNVVETVAAITQGKVEVERPTKPLPADEPSDEENEVEKIPQPVAVAYEPPFPERMDLFVAPKRLGRGSKNSPDGFGNSVELLGFVNVNGQRVVLSIDGLVSPLAVGSEQAGIEVISIQPPVAVLQRGRQRWQVTLEN